MTGFPSGAGSIGAEIPGNWQLPLWPRGASAARECERGWLPPPRRGSGCAAPRWREAAGAAPRSDRSFLPPDHAAGPPWTAALAHLLLLSALHQPAAPSRPSSGPKQERQLVSLLDRTRVRSFLDRRPHLPFWSAAAGQNGTQLPLEFQPGKWEFVAGTFCRQTERSYQRGF